MASSTEVVERHMQNTFQESKIIAHASFTKSNVIFLFSSTPKLAMASTKSEDGIAQSV
jgi:hypothetical protein